MSAAKKRILGIAFVIFLVVLWQILAMFIGKTYILPSPAEVMEHIWKNRAELFSVHLPATMQVVATGLAFSVVLGLVFALAMDMSNKVERALYPLLTVSQTIPTICIAPVFVLWFGYSVTMRVIVVVLVNFFSITVNVFDGLKSTSVGRTELMQTYGSSSGQRMFMLRIPTALPDFFTALKVAVPWSIVGAAVAEWLGAPSGLGMYSRSCMMSLDAAGLLAPLVILSIIALILYGGLGIIENNVFTWRGEV